MLFYQPEGKVVNRFHIFIALLKAFRDLSSTAFNARSAFTKKMN